MKASCINFNCFEETKNKFRRKSSLFSFNKRNPHWSLSYINNHGFVYFVLKKRRPYKIV